MTRQEAINVILNLWKFIDRSHDSDIGIDSELIRQAFNLAIKVLEEDWIPCSERLPDDLAEVIVTWVNHEPETYYDFIKDKPFTAPAVYYKGKWFWWTQYTQDLLSEYCERCNVGEVDKAIEIIAWMPLPEPYAERKTDG